MIPFLILAFSSIIQGSFGIGIALIGLPLLSIVYTTKFAVAVLHMVNIVCTTTLAIYLRKHILVKEALLLSGVSLISTPIGAYLFKILPVDLIQNILGLTIIIASLVLLFDPKFKPKRYWLSIGIGGWLGGILGGLLGIAGPPIILIFTGLGIVKDQFRATLSAYFAVIGLTAISINVYNQQFTPEMVTLASVLAPVALCGLFIGSKLAHKVSGPLFRKIILIILIVSTLFLFGGNS